MLNIPLKDHFRQTRIFNARLSIAAAVLLILVTILAVRLSYLQLVAHKRYATLAQANRVRPVPVPPVRGLILDRNGVVLASSYPVYTLEIVPEQVDDMKQTLAELGGLVNITEADLKQFNKQLRERPRFEALTLRTHLTDEEAAKIAVRRPYLQGVDLQARLQRHYPLGGLAVHAVGYVGRINESDLERIDKRSYRGLQHIGKLGLEEFYEGVLVGSPGFENMETDAHGRSGRMIEPRIPPVAGKNLHLNLDAKLQEIAEQAMAKWRGAIIALDPKTGGILAFVSTPTYDPNRFVNGIDPDTYRSLLNDPDKPLINRALNGVYSPGSTIKSFFSLAALETPTNIFDASRQTVCPGQYTLDGRHWFRDWKKGGHGTITLKQAVAQSCDVYFYKFAQAVGIEAIHDFLQPFGFGEPTGVDLSHESKGILPSPAWKKARGLTWFPGETVMTGIGQGPILATPLQLASGVAALSNDLLRFKPRLVHDIENAGTRERTELPLDKPFQIPVKDKKHLAQTIENMMAVAQQGGTAYGIGWNSPYLIAGKTGTAQVKGIAQGASYNEHATPERLRDHALFVCFAPADDPKVAIAVVVENGGHGASVAAPIARKLMDYVILGYSGPTPATKANVPEGMILTPPPAPVRTAPAATATPAPAAATPPPPAPDEDE